MLHPQARALLDLLVARQVPEIHTLDPAQARAAYRDRRALSQPDPEQVALVEELHIPGPAGAIAARHYRPLGSGANEILPALIFYHGGGWVIGDLETHDVLCRALSNAAGCAVIAVDYRLAPEARFPAAFDDSFAACRWVFANAGKLGVDANRLAVGGDSAGGNLAASVAIAAREAGDLALRYQLLIYPATDQVEHFPSRTSNGRGYLLTANTMRYFHDHYIDQESHDLDWRASPLRASRHNNLPPALVLTAGFDPLLDEGRAYAKALTAAGTACSYVCFERQIHGFITMGRVLAEAHTAIALCGAELKRALAPI